VGETATRTVLEADVGATTDPVRSSMGYHVLQVLERAPSATPPFEQIVDIVRTEHRRRADDGALRSGLDALRRAASVRVVPSLP
jgi:parvulin-like peptidyl-prolyl isomerase